MARLASWGAARRAVLLTGLRAANWCAVAATWDPKGWSWELVVAILLASLLSWQVLHTDPYVVAGCLPPSVRVLLQLDALLEAFGGGPRVLIAPAVSQPKERRPSIELPTRGPALEEGSTGSFASSQCSSALLDPSVLASTSQPSLRAASQLRVLRKLVVARLPEAMVSAVMSVSMVVNSVWDWRGSRGLGSESLGGAGGGQVDAGTFNGWFRESRHAIIRRTCKDCEHSHRDIYYRRFTKTDVWEPYPYMTSNWTQTDNEFHVDFELYSTYRDAVRNTSRWQSCSFGEGQGFPGECAPGASPVLGQWCNLGSKCPVSVSFEVERSLAWHDFVENPFHSSWTDDHVEVAVPLAFTLVSLLCVATGIADTVVYMWIQTDFVKAYSRLVVFFYFLEVCSWLPLLVLCYSDGGWLLQTLALHLGLMICLITCGFNHKKVRKRGSTLRRLCDLLGQCTLAALLAPLVFLVNFLFFDRSLTFRTLNNWYYVIRFLHTAVIVVQLCLRSSWADALSNPACASAVVSSVLLALMVWGVVPWKRARMKEATVKLYEERTAAAAGAAGDLEHASQVEGPRLAPVLGDVDHGFVEVLNTVGDVFEALLLASHAVSPRVRCAVLEVAVRPLVEASRELPRQLLPLILPQLLLSLRWRTVENGDDERCPLSRFLLECILGAQDHNLVAEVYWQLFALSADRAHEAHEVYRAARRRLLQALCEASFCEHRYDEEFCRLSLCLIADQCRLYHQMRSIARMIGRVKGSHAEKTHILRSVLGSFEFFKRWQGVSCFDNRAPASARASLARGGFGSSPLGLEQAAGRSRRSRIKDRLGSWSGRPRRAEPDPVREELWQDDVLQAYESTDLNIMKPGGRSLPVDPTLGIASIDQAGSFVAHSAVAPTVICCRPSLAGDETSRRLLAVKIGNDLRQDALVLQMFRLMQTAWEADGLTELALRPYNVLPVSPLEGIVSFVPSASKVSDILSECEGDVAKWIEGHNVADPSGAFDRLCGSTAGYCVATYLLGVGDRHLDNLMITEDGHFFHIDFGFVLGDDPKPLSPTVRVPREVIEAIKASHRYEFFKELVAKAFSLLRRTSRLWTSLLSLTKEAGGNGVTALMHQGLEVLLERLHLELDEAAAQSEVVAEVEASVASDVPVLFDKLHQVGLFWN